MIFSRYHLYLAYKKEYLLTKIISKIFFESKLI